MTRSRRKAPVAIDLRPATIVRRPVARGRGARFHDPDGAAWQFEADRRWQRAHARPERYDAPRLPDFRAAAPAHVSREILGRFLVDRDAQVLHDVAHATEDCAIDGIANATWIHFAHELEGHVDAAIADCPHCIGAEA